MKLLLDLYCGLGGWAEGFILEGWYVIGVDIGDFSKSYPGKFIRADLTIWKNWRGIPADLVISSAPCDEFARWSMPWTRARKPPKPSLKLWNIGHEIASGLGVPLIRENVRGAQPFVGSAVTHYGPFYLWDNVPPLIPPRFTGKKKESFGSKQKAERAKIPVDLARWVARSFS